MKMAIYTQKCGLFTLKNNNKGEGGSWVEKNRKINNQGGDDYSRLESKCTSRISLTKSEFSHSFSFSFSTVLFHVCINRFSPDKIRSLPPLPQKIHIGLKL